MTKNVTLRMDEELLRQLRHRAVDERMSLSGWVVAVLRQTVCEGQRRDAVQQRALLRLEQGFHLGGTPISRDQAHER